MTVLWVYYYKYILGGQIDDELVAMVLSIAEDPNISEPPEFSPKANTSQGMDVFTQSYVV